MTNSLSRADDMEMFSDGRTLSVLCNGSLTLFYRLSLMLSVHCPSKSFHIHALVLIILDRRRRVVIAFHKKGSGFTMREDPKMLSCFM